MKTLPSKLIKIMLVPFFFLSFSVRADETAGQFVREYFDSGGTGAIPVRIYGVENNHPTKRVIVTVEVWTMSDVIRVRQTSTRTVTIGPASKVQVLSLSGSDHGGITVKGAAFK
jgi:hypothetical protein